MTRRHSRPGMGTRPFPAGVVRVSTRNVYVGAQVDGVLFAPSLEVLPRRVDDALRAVLASRFPERARVLARDLAEADADIVALQEVARLVRRAPAGRAEPRIDDYLEMLLETLRAEGAPYLAVGICQAADVELPSASGDVVRLTARNVLLARDDVRVGAVASDCYATNLRAMAGGPGGRQVAMLRGWVSADILIGQRTLRVINTHFEVQSHAGVQRAQCEELLRFVAKSPHPVVVLGDLNSDALGGDTDSYRLLLASGLRDAWRELRDDPGYTCCHDADLRNATLSFTKRIDHVLVGQGIDVLDVELVGADVTSRTTSGLWASDHAGVTASLRLRE